MNKEKNSQYHVMDKRYKVTWRVDIWAKNEIDAAKEAKRIQIDPDSIANFFSVQEYPNSKKINVDLDKMEENK